MTPEQLDEIEKLAADGASKAAGYYALPLVKAVREARALKQQWAADADAKEALLQSVALVCRGAKEPDQADLSVLGNVLRERDEARAELKERQELLEQAVVERASALAERNWANERYHEARAEVERLRSALRLLWEEAQDKCAIRDATTDAVEAALKEGDR